MDITTALKSNGDRKDRIPAIRSPRRAKAEHGKMLARFLNGELEQGTLAEWCAGMRAFLALDERTDLLDRVEGVEIATGIKQAKK